MKPLEKNNTLVSSVNNTTSFKMKTSKETFEIFTDQIYEHKKRAIIRELSCNAHDSHKDAGKGDVPFRIHFPTMFEPYFEVEDFGVGLDDYDIRGEEKILYDKNGNEVSRYMEGGIYTTYFASSKRESNETIGHLGLGSKSPMSYTKSMTIVARKNGVERHYVCFIGENGEPQTTFNSEKETDKGNGVCIRFSVAQADFEEFKREAGFVLAMFKVKPETNVSINYLLDDTELSSIVDGSLIIDSNHPFHNHEPAYVYCNMGGVVYPVRNLDYLYLSNDIMVNEDAYNTGIDEEPEYYKFNEGSVEFIRSMIDKDKRFIINYPIGDLSFMTSREGLSQDSQTKFNFYKRLVEVIGKEVSELQVNIDKSRQPLEAINTFATFTDPWDKLGRKYYFNNKSVSEWISLRAFTDVRSIIEDDSKFICHYKDYRGNGIWGNTDTCIRRKNIFLYNYFDIYEFMKKQKKFICFYANTKDDYKGLTNAIRFYMKNKDIGEKVFFFYEPGCYTSTFKGFKDVFYGNIEFRHISKLVEEVKDIEPAFFDKKRNSSKNNKSRASKKNETKAVVISYKAKLRPNEKSHYRSSLGKVIVDLSNLNPKTTMYVERLQGSSYYDYTVSTSDGHIHDFKEPDLRKYMNNFGIKTCIIADGINKGRISKSDIPSLSSIIEQYVADNHDYFIDNWVYDRGLSEDLKDSVNDNDERIIMERLSYRYKDDFIYLYDNDDQYTRPLCDEYVKSIREFAKNNPDEKYYNMKKFVGRFFNISEDDTITASKIEEQERELHEYFSEVVEGVKDRYPLLFGIDNNEKAVLEYVELVNAKHDQMKEVA